MTRHSVLVVAVACALQLLLVPEAPAAESPRSSDAAMVDTPVLRIPMTSKPPTIDGAMAEGEWEDAAALSGFWYDYSQADFRFLAPVQTQLQVYAMYDKDNLYIAFTSPVYPEASWLKAQGRFPDVLEHPLYGALWDDHTELELRPYHDAARGFRLGLLRWDVNPIDTIVDWYWSQQGGYDMAWKSNAKVRSTVTAKRWVIEYAIPFECMLTGNYKGKEADGTPLVTIPPTDGTIYRAWFVRGIGGNGSFFNAFDNHIWNTTKTQLVFDSKAVSFQVNELGPIMDDQVDVQLTVKNHNTQSETVKLGFFVEGAGGLAYSSYDSPDLKDGLLELRPGEVRQLRLQKSAAGISANGNVLWFDVRSAGTPAKVLFRTRLIRFHSMDGGAAGGSITVLDPQTGKPQKINRALTFRERRLDVIATLRPPKRDFDFNWSFSNYTRRLAAVVDKGLRSASEEAKTAREATLTVTRKGGDEAVVKEIKAVFHGDFACFQADLPELADGGSYRLSLLLFDKNMRIVGERDTEPFTYKVEPWMGNKLGLDDVVWEPFEAIKVADGSIETLKHRFALAPTGLPAQIYIKPDPRDLPLERRGPDAKLSDAELQELGRGPQLRSPMLIEAVVDGKRLAAEAVSPAKLVRQWKSEVECASKLKIGPLAADLTARYDCDGSLHCRLVYGADQPAKIDLLEMSMPVDGQTDLATFTAGHSGMAGADVWECSLPAKEGVVWDSRKCIMDLRYGRFVPWFWFGSADRAFTWFADSDAGWILDKEGSTMHLERDKAGKITWKVQFVNHPAEVAGKRTIEFTILTHPAKPKPKNFRLDAWHYYAGYSWAAGYAGEPYDIPEATLKAQWRQAACAPKDWPDEKVTEWRKDDPPFFRFGKWRNVQSNFCPELDQVWEDKATYFFERQIRVGRRVGWWMDEYFPVTFGRSDNVAMGNAYYRDPNTVAEGELPWQSGFLTGYMRNHYKRLARVSQANNVPQRQHTWSNNAATMLESVIWSSLLVEECGAGHRSFEVDQVTQFPNSLYRYMSHNWTGLVTALAADTTDARSGDDKRLDRQHLGRALLNDIGIMPTGPHGTIHHREQSTRLLAALTRFGFFQDDGIEKLPFWRIEKYLQLGDKPSQESEVYVTVYRRPLESGAGAKAIFVVMNESDGPAELPLRIVDVKRLLGGPNTLKASDVRIRQPVPDPVRAWWDSATARDADATVLMDLETGDVVARSDDKNETYGPLYVPYHDFRLLYAQSGGDK